MFTYFHEYFSLNVLSVEKVGFGQNKNADITQLMSQTVEQNGQYKEIHACVVFDTMQVQFLAL